MLRVLEHGPCCYIPGKFVDGVKRGNSRTSTWGSHSRLTKLADAVVAVLRRLHAEEESVMQFCADCSLLRGEDEISFILQPCDSTLPHGASAQGSDAAQGIRDCFQACSLLQDACQDICNLAPFGPLLRSTHALAVFKQEAGRFHPGAFGKV